MNVQIFISDRQCIVAQRTRKSLHVLLEVANSEEGLRKFERFIMDAGVTCSSILTDFVEEDYRVEYIPHLGWLDRRRFLEKKLNQLYKQTPFRNRLIDGHEGGGERVLFSALTNPNLLLPWVDSLLMRKIPISGISSVAMLSGKLLPKNISSHLLLLSFQQGSGLRQSFFLNGKLHFSRLTLVHPDDDRIGIVRSESEKVYKYLHALSLLPEKGMLSVLILCGMEEGELLDEAMMESVAIHPIILDLSEIAKEIGLDGRISDALPLFQHLFGKSVNHYGSEQHTHGYELMQWRHAATALSIALILGGVSLSAIDAGRALEFKSQAALLASRTLEAESRYRSIRQPGRDSPQKINEVVSLDEMIESKFPSPGKMLVKVGHALVPFTDIRINRLSWQVAGNAGSAKAVSGEFEPGSGFFEPGPSQVAFAIDGEIYPFDGSYRHANETVERFCKDLEKAGMHISKVKLPLDLNPSANLVGRFRQGEESASFVLEGFMKVGS